MKEEAVCRKVDGYIHKIYQSKDATTKAEARKHIFWVYSNYIDHDNPKAQWFRQFQQCQADIVCDIIFDEETRRIVSVLVCLSNEDLEALVIASDKHEFLFSRRTTAESQLKLLEEEFQQVANELRPATQ
jgi:hypothetical protein